MDKLREQLQHDADAVDATVPAALRERIDAHWQTTEPVRPHIRRRRILTLGSVLAGLAAIAVVFAARQLSSPDAPVAIADGTDATTQAQPLPVDAVDLAGPLQQELTNLQADLKLARDSIERELRRTL